jgi:hypothetical protein
MHAPTGIQTRNPNKLAAADPRRRNRTTMIGQKKII